MALVILSTAPELRIGDLQLVEMLQTARIVFVGFLLASTGLNIPSRGVWREYGRPYLWFLAGSFFLAIAALRLPFYPPPSQTSFLKTPFVLSLSRLFELSLGLYCMLAIADTLQHNPRLIRISLNIYVAAGAVASIFSIGSFGIYVATGADTYFINGLDHRARGFFNEGGPFGLFLISVILVLLMKRRLAKPSFAVVDRMTFVIVWIAMLLSESKAGLLAAIICAIASLFTPNLRRRTLTAVLIPVGLIFFFGVFETTLANYKDNFENFDAMAFFRPNDRNLVMGRIIGAFIIPRMIAAHPVLGIGIGNYSLMRNDPDYLQGLPAVDDWDLAGLGLLSDAAELGIPMTLFLVWILIRLPWRAKKERAPAILIAAAAFQPVSLLLGINLNFFYPWLVTSFAFASLVQYRIADARPIPNVLLDR